MNHLFKRSFSLLLALVMCLSLTPILPFASNAEEYETLATFELGANGSASHADGSSKTTYSETDGDYTLSITSGTNFYTGARDAKGNSCFKLGSSSKTGSFSITVPSDVTQVVISAAKYKTNTTKISVNGTAYTLTKNSNNGEYDEITVDTTSSKTVTFTTVSGGVRAMVNTIVFKGAASGEAECTHANTTTTTVAATCTTTGSITVTCDDCGEEVSSEPIPTIDHVDENNDDICDNCGKSTLAWTLVTDASVLTVNAQVIIVAAEADVALSTTQNGNNRGQTAVTKGTNVIEEISDEVQVLTLKKGNVDGTFALYTGSGYLNAASSSSNYLRTETTLSDNSSWAISISDGVASVVAQGSYTRNVMQHNATSGIFACYGSASQKAISLYYIPAPGCSHPNMQTFEEKAATCTEVGNTAGKYCPDCTYAEGYEEIEALGHAWDDGTVVAPTYNENGYTLYTCSRCDETKQENETDALKYINIVYFAVPEGVEPVASMTSGKDGIKLPEANSPEGYEFVGWTENKVDNTETMPEKYVAGQTFKPQAETTLYALYSVTTGGSEGRYELKDISEISATDSVVITMTTSDGTIYALTNGNGTSAAPAGTTVTAENNKLTSEVTQNLKWNVVAVDGGYEIYPQGSTSSWLYCTNTNNGVRVGTNTAKLFTIDGNYLKHSGTSRYVGVYTTNPDWRCYTSINDNIKNQTLGFYVESAAGTATYTTAGSTAPEAAFVVDGKAYVTFEAAMRAHSQAGTYIKLQGDVTADVTLTQNVYLDLAGYDWNGTITTGTYMLYGMDSTTDDYDCTDGYGTISKVVGKLETQYKTAITGKIRRYVTYTEADGTTVSFHRIYVGITSMSLRPGVEGVGYKATYAGDQKVEEMVSGYGYNLWLDGYKQNVVTKGVDVSNFNAKDHNVVSALLKNFDVEQYSETLVYATAYITINGETIVSSEYSYTLRSLIEIVANDLEKGQGTYTDAQLAALQAMCLNYEDVVKDWTYIDNILQWSAA